MHLRRQKRIDNGYLERFLSKSLINSVFEVKVMTTYKDNVKAKISRIFSARRFIKGAWLLESVEFKSIPFINETRLLPLSLRPVVGRHLNRRLEGFSFLTFHLDC